MGRPRVWHGSGRGRKGKEAVSGRNKVLLLRNAANSRSGHQSLHTKPENVRKVNMIHTCLKSSRAKYARFLVQDVLERRQTATSQN